MKKKQDNKISMQKIIYFDEESITDYVQIVEGGKMEKTIELLNETEGTLGTQTKASGTAGISGKRWRKSTTNISCVLRMRKRYL